MAYCKQRVQRLLMKTQTNVTDPFLFLPTLIIFVLVLILWLCETVFAQNPIEIRFLTSCLI